MLLYIIINKGPVFKANVFFMRNIKLKPTKKQVFSMVLTFIPK